MFYKSKTLKKLSCTAVAVGLIVLMFTSVVPTRVFADDALGVVTDGAVSAAEVGQTGPGQGGASSSSPELEGDSVSVIEDAVAGPSEKKPVSGNALPLQVVNDEISGDEGSVDNDVPSGDATGDGITESEPSEGEGESQDLNVPVLNAPSVEEGGYKVSWSAVPGADGYAVYRKVSGGSWAMFATTEQTSYIDGSSLEAGETYLYTVRAYRGAANVAIANRYDSAFWSLYDKSAEGRRVSWKPVDGASGYAVYRKASGGGWAIHGTTASTSYTDVDALSPGKSYSYTVRAYRGDEASALANKYSSLCWGGHSSSGLKATCLAVPELYGVSAAATGREVSWSAVPGASGYAVYRKASDGGWGMIGTTTRVRRQVQQVQRPVLGLLRRGGGRGGLPCRAQALEGDEVFIGSQGDLVWRLQGQRLRSLSQGLRW